MERNVSVSFAWRGGPWQRARTGVSLHSHTSHSQEPLDFIPRFTANVPIVRDLIRAQERKYREANNREMNYYDAWWTPPLGPREALAVERGQIEKLGLLPLVSISDHDNIEAPLLLRVLSESRHTPVSVEWTVPYKDSFFHLGAHNLPPRRATQCMEALAAYTANPVDSQIEHLLAWLSDEPDTLIVLNHPYWDEKGFGVQKQVQLADEFIGRYRPFLHALELNGLRPWSENRRIIALAERTEKPVISGGDRHCCEPNALINLTNAATFSEFVEEVREYGRSRVLVMPQYREALLTRILKSVADVMRDNRAHTHGWVRWSDRVFFRNASGKVESLSSVWNDGSEPALIHAFALAARYLDHGSLRFAIRQFAQEARELT